jgi:hypothetical protein
LLPALAILLPVSFVVASWIYAQGIPYYVDSNETFLSFMHARNMQLWNPLSFSFLTAETTDPRSQTVQNLYTHNPNFPRYIHYLLLISGLSTLSSQVLVIATVGTLISVVFALKAVRYRIDPSVFSWLTLVLAFDADYVGFLSFAVNTYRVFTFVLFWGCVASITGAWSFWGAFAIFFMLFQFEYAFALFVLITCATFVVLDHGRRAWKSLIAGMGGAVLSIAVFLGQVIKQNGVDGVLTDIDATVVRRGLSAGTDGSATPIPILLLNQAAETISASLATIEAFYGRLVVLIVIWAVASSPVLLAGHRFFGPPELPERGPRIVLSRLLTATVIGALITGTALHGYFMQTYVGSAIPFFTFFVAISVGVLCIDFMAVDRRTLRLFKTRWQGIIPLVVLLPLISNSFAKFHLPVDGTGFRLLERDLSGEAFVAPSNDYHLVFALTGGPTAALDDGRQAVLSSDIPRLKSFTGDSTQNLYYACFDIVSGPAALLNGQPAGRCRAAAGVMQQDGHTVVQQGKDYVVFKLDLAGQAGRRGTDEALTRDAQRRSDLQTLQAALLSYHAEYGRFPCSGDNGWVWSTAGADWLSDKPETCSAKAKAELHFRLPIDPTNSGPEPWAGGYEYGYRGFRSGCPPSSNGQFFVLAARLEITHAGQDFQRVRDCTGDIIPWQDDVIALTSDTTPTGAR